MVEDKIDLRCGEKLDIDWIIGFEYKSIVDLSAQYVRGQRVCMSGFVVAVQID